MKLKRSTPPGSKGVQSLSQEVESVVQTGDVACLKSGGPTLSVGPIQKGIATVDWYDATGRHHSAKFALAQLQLVRPHMGVDFSRLTSDEIAQLAALLERARTSK